MALATWILGTCGCVSVKPRFIRKDAAFLAALESRDQVGLGEFRARHLLPPGQQIALSLVLPLAGNAMAACPPQTGLVLPGRSEYSDVPHLAELNRRCLREIQAVLSKSTRFKFIPVEALVPPAGSGPRGAGQVRSLCAQNKLDAAVGVVCRFALAGGWEKTLSVDMHWDICDADGRRRTTVFTVASTRETFEVIPNVRDARYAGHYVQLARKNAEDFLRLLNGDRPLHGNYGQPLAGN